MGSYREKHVMNVKCSFGFRKRFKLCNFLFSQVDLGKAVGIFLVAYSECIFGVGDCDCIHCMYLLFSQLTAQANCL